MNSDAMTAEQAEGEVRATRDAIIETVLPQVAFDGWTMKAVTAAVEVAGYPPGTADRVFPNGVIEVLSHLADLSDRKLLAGMAERDVTAMGVRDRIAAAVRLRIEINGAYKEAIRRAVSFLALPQNVAVAAGNTLRTVDALWYAAGDTATDFSYYSKRALLAPVYVATVLYWLDDDSEDSADTWAFLDRRLDDVLEIPRLGRRLRTLLNPLSWLKGRDVRGDLDADPA
jgi:ubiquinone biosynthesis protein COQ9